MSDDEMEVIMPASCSFPISHAEWKAGKCVRCRGKRPDNVRFFCWTCIDEVSDSDARYVFNHCGYWDEEPEPPNPRDAELATLRAQLADAMARQLTPEGRLPPALADLVEELEQENLALEKRLADAQRVIDAARPVRKADGSKIMERVRAFEQALHDYDAKHGAKEKP